MHNTVHLQSATYNMQCPAQNTILLTTNEKTHTMHQIMLSTDEKDNLFKRATKCLQYSAKLQLLR